MSLIMEQHLKEIIGIVQKRSQLLLIAPPGTGKSTLVPLEIIKTQPDARVLVLEPRRVAARSLAQYLSNVLNENLGETVGYHFRHEKRMSSKTRLLFVTEGMMLRYAQSDPALSEFSHIVLDEFHERHLFTDISVAFLKRLSTTRELKLIVMSATLHIESLQKYLPAAQVYQIDQEQHALRIYYANSSDHLKEVKTYLQTIKQDENILFFLPGKGEINFWNQQLPQITDRPITQLHGDLSVEEQMKALQVGPSGKIILATNIAESALTVDGVRHVIDSGEKRSIRYDLDIQKVLLEKKWISRSSAIQRAGRAHRQGPGTCLRLYDESRWRQFLEHDVPEILRSDLSSVILQVARSMGSIDIEWFEAPRVQHIELAIRQLTQLGALKSQELTPVGLVLSELPYPANWSLFILESENQNDQLRRIEWMIFCLDGKHPVGATIEIIENHPSAPRERVQQTLREFNLSDHQKIHFSRRPMRESLIEIFFDQVAQKTKSSEKFDTYKLAGGAAVTFERKIGEMGPDYMVVLTSHQTKNGTEKNQKAQVVAQISESDLLKSNACTVVEHYQWNSSREVVEKFSLLKFGDLSLMSEREAIDDFDEKAGLIFLKEKLKLQLPTDLDNSLVLERLSHRFNVESLRDVLARLSLALSNDAAAMAIIKDPNKWIPLVMAGVLSSDKLDQIDWLAKLSIEFTQDEWRKIENDMNQNFPIYLQLRTKKFKVHYSELQPPKIEARIQEFFGLNEPLTLNAGRTKVNLHLLGPNMRALQVTQDLPNFWAVHYPQLRRELQRRYPKHLWPEDPTRPISQTDSKRK